jgi:ferrochelatase
VTRVRKSRQVDLGVLLVNFGEPSEATPEIVEPFLERIFLLNAGLEPGEEAVARAKELAARRAPALTEEYVAIGGSPLNRQADAQAVALERQLRGRGSSARVYSAFQFTPPDIASKLREARADGVDSLVAVPIYPLCGASTTGAALEAVERELTELRWEPRYVGIAGWHRQEEYVGLRAEGVRRFAADHGLDLGAPDTLLYFSAHGTPVTYIKAGSRYDRYVHEHCRSIADASGADRFVVGFQNHRNRRVDWTSPDNDELIERLSERRLVIVPVSFMHEQSETLAELDGELRERCEALGKEYWRVPVPHDSPRFVSMLADLVQTIALQPDDQHGLAVCECVTCAHAWCTNAGRVLPPSPYVTL